MPKGGVNERFFTSHIVLADHVGKGVLLCSALGCPLHILALVRPPLYPPVCQSEGSKEIL